MDDSHEGPQWELTLPCLGADNGPSKWRPPLILACKSQLESNGLHLEGSEFTSKSLGTATTVTPGSAAEYFSLANGGGVGGVIRGFAIGVHCSNLTPTLARCPPRWSVCIYVCVISFDF